MILVQKGTTRIVAVLNVSTFTIEDYWRFAPQLAPVRVGIIII